MDSKGENRGARQAWRAVPAFLAFLLAGILMATLIQAAGNEIVLNPSTDPVPASYFNLNILFHPATKVPWPSVPFYGWRVWHALWADVEPQRGQWHFDLLDKYVDWATQHNTQVLLILSYTPQWASSRPDVDASWYRGASGAPTNQEYWREFVRTVGTRYKGRIHTYEIWNEPDRPQDWTGDVDTMVSMVRDASEILKGIDPTVRICSPSAEQAKGVPWLNEFLAKGGGNYVDAIGYHFYVPHSPPEAMVTLIQKVKAVMHENGVGEKPLWDTEAGWLGPDSFSDEQASAYVARAFILNWAARVDRFYWYAWDDHHGNEIEVTTKDNTSLTAAGRAYSTIHEWLVGSVMKQCRTEDGQIWTCELNRDGRTQHLVWSVGGRRDYRIPPDWRVERVTRLDGQIATITGGSIPADFQPVRVE